MSDTPYTVRRLPGRTETVPCAHYIPARLQIRYDGDLVKTLPANIKEPQQLQNLLNRVYNLGATDALSRQ